MEYHGYKIGEYGDTKSFYLRKENPYELVAQGSASGIEVFDNDKIPMDVLLTFLSFIGAHGTDKDS